jgi:hypothetical protein
VEPETARVDTVIAPASVAVAQVEELAGRVSVAVKVDLQGGLLGVGEGSSEAAGAVQEIVEAGGKLGVVGELGRDLGAYIPGVRHPLHCACRELGGGLGVQSVAVVFAGISCWLTQAWTWG